MDLETFNAATRRDADAVLLSCCASRRFAAAVTAGRPYPSLDAAEAATSVTFESLTWDDVLEALENHPRIGARAAGSSRAEQSGVTDFDRGALAAANAEYEARFGHVFLICASGLTGGQMLTELRARLANNPDTERIVATRELQKITVLRLRKALTP
ncbi:MAG TPA: 2-oxo-4-hydroxy-4-carboxy-5-ureidoimidazoline decarboxylase [Trebonia sp.]